MSNAEKSRALGMNFSTASQRLRKLILWQLLVEADGLVDCFQCGQQIEDVDDMSIEHKRPWQSDDDPRAAFFDLENIAFSHLRCNVGAYNREKPCCPVGHEYTSDNTVRRGGKRSCRECLRQQERRRWHSKGRAAERRRRRHNSA